MTQKQYHSFFQYLQKKEKVPLDLKINDNRSTMLSVKWEQHQTKVSLHRIFLDAPPRVMDALACYIWRKHKVIDPLVKKFIETKLPKLNYSHLLACLLKLFYAEIHIIASVLRSWHKP